MTPSSHHLFTPSPPDWTIQATVMSKKKTLTEVKRNSRSCLLWKNLAHKTTGCPTHYKNVQYQETDKNQINKLPTWGILFNKTLTKEDEINTIIKVIILSAKRERE